MKLLKPAWIAAEGNPLFSVDIHPDGTRFATGGQGGDSAVGRICIWNLKPILDADAAEDEQVPKLLSQMDRHLGCVNCLRWSPSGAFLASGADDNCVMIWKKSSGGGGTIFGGGGKVNVESWRCVHTLTSHQGDVLDLAWSPGDALLATASVDNTVIVWNGQQLPEKVATLKGHSGLVKGVAFDPVGKFLATQSDDKTMRVWRLADWKEETCVKEPFRECGATTHCLRPGWSPDGSMLVSAHAMNEGGPTAQIVDRGSWKTERDFVGHKKAITCIRFNPNLFEREGGAGDRGKNYVMVALGSRDRSFSCWSTNLKRPLFVVTDAFDQSVVDLSWSKDGKVLLTCSMDGTVAAVILKSGEVGRAISEEKLYDCLSKSYGKNFGLPTIKSKPQTNGTAALIVAENPELLASSKAAAAAAASKVSSKQKASVVRGPTDKQIEARTSDGKRRITPIFIPPDEAEKSFGSGEFQSLSTKETSNIAIEKREGVVKPNVSPGKSSSAKATPSGSAGNSNSSSQSAARTTPTAGPSKTKEESNDGINVIQVRKKPRKRVLSSSDEEEDKEVDAGKSNRTEKKRDEEKTDDLPAKFKELAQSKPNLLVAKRKTDGGDESPKPKKRGRPPLNRSREEEHQQVASTSAQIFARAKEEDPAAATRGRGGGGGDAVSPVVVVGSSSVALGSSAVLPPLLIAKFKSETFCTSDGVKRSVQVTNNFRKLGEETALHLAKFLRSSTADVDSTNAVDEEKGRKVTLEVLLPSPVNGIAVCSDLVLLSCLDSSVHIFSPQGDRLMPPLMTPSPLSKMTALREKFAAVTTTGKFFLWQFRKESPGRPEIVIRNECILSLLERRAAVDDEGNESPVTVSRLSLTRKTSKPLIVTSVGKSFMFDEGVGAWLKVADNDDSVVAVSSYSAESFSVTSSLPLSCLEGAARDHSGGGEVSSKLRSMADVAHCEVKLAAAKYLRSASEYKHWLCCLVRHLTQEGGKEAEGKLRDLFDSLLAKEVGKGRDYLGLDRLDLLGDLLKVLARGVAFQRMYADYQEQLGLRRNGGEDNALSDLNGLLHDGVLAMNVK